MERLDIGMRASYFTKQGLDKLNEDEKTISLTAGVLYDTIKRNNLQGVFK